METERLVPTWSLAARCAFVTVACMPALAASVGGEPINLAVSSYPSATQALVSWASDNPSTTAFAVERRAVGARTWVTVAALPASQLQFIDSNLGNLRGFEYRVRSFLAGGAAAGQLSSSTVILVTPDVTAVQADYDAAATPRNVDAQAVSPTEVIVTWADQTPDGTNFKIERRQGTGTWTAIATPAADTTLFKDSGLLPANSYEYRVSVDRNGQVSPPSAGKLASTPAVGSTTLRYVDGSDCKPGTAGGSGTLANPWKTIQSAVYGGLKAGETLLVRNRADCAIPTVYRTTANATTGKHAFAVVDISNDAAAGQFADGGVRSGTPTAWITYRNYPGERPKLRTNRGGLTPTGGTTNADSGNFHGFSVRNASYIVIDGFEIEGHMNDVTLAEATALNAAYKAANAPTTAVPITSIVDSNGISVGNSGTTAAQANQIPHHVIVRNNVVYNVTGGGINGLVADWLTFENNRVSNVAWYSPYGSSAINILKAKDIGAAATDYKLVIQNNYAADSGNLFPCKCFNWVQPTDGNGIIIDSFRSTTGPVLPAYAGKTLIQNNIVTNNGARGIHVLNSENVDIAFNTAVRNGTVAITADGEITAQKTRNVRAFNNVAVANANRPLYSITFASAAAKTADGATINFDYNLYFGGVALPAETATTGLLGVNNRLNLDPRFAPGTGTGTFRLQGNSPALNSAWPGFAAPSLDFFQSHRPRGGAADVGAVESF